MVNCHYDLAARGLPPEELLEPGKMQFRTHLSEESLCFLWYSASFWTRPTGGALGLELSRQGGSVDNKVNLVKWVQGYEAEHGCPANQVLLHAIVSTAAPTTMRRKGRPGARKG